MGKRKINEQLNIAVKSKDTKLTRSEKRLLKRYMTFCKENPSLSEEDAILAFGNKEKERIRLKEEK